MSKPKVQQQSNAVQAMAEAAASGSLAARNTLLLSLTPMIVRAAENAAHLTSDRDDAVQDGYLYMLGLIDRYDPAAGVCFLHYAKTHLHYYYIRRTQFVLSRHHMSLGTPVSPDDPMPVAETLPAEAVAFDAVFEREDRARHLAHALERLSPTERKVIRLSLAGHDSRAIAQMLGNSEKTVSNLKARAKRKLTR